MKGKLLSLLVAAPLLAAAALAEEAPAAEDAGTIEEIIVLAHPLGREGLAQAADVLEADELERKTVDNIGATVGNEPGIHNSSYGVGAGRPVIHGLGGPRVRIMEDRIDTLDVSVSSGDHAVTVDPFVAERVEILKGSATLLYGSGAIGGVVDVQTGRIPQEVPERIRGAVNLRGNNNGNGRNGSFRLGGGSGSIAWHVDAFAREADDYDIPGFAESAALRAQEEEEHHDDEHHEEEGHHDDEHDDDEHHDDEHHDEEEAQGRLPGSGLETRGGSVGLSWVGDRGFVGLSVSNLDSDYGIPGHSHDHGHGHDEHDHEEMGHHEDEDHHEEDEHHEHEAEGAPIVDLEQTRIDLKAALANPFGGFENLSFRLGINDYEHVENEAGEAGTAFSNQAWEARAELTHGPAGGWRGAFGIQLGDREFSVAGEEAFTPPVDTSSAGLFWVGERSLGRLGLEAGLRYDRVEHDPAGGSSRDFSGGSASLGLIVPLSQGWEGTLLADFSSRAPVGEELFSDAPHPGTGFFEIGDLELGHEKARNLAATLAGRGDRWSVSGTFYHTDFADFIYQAATNEERSGFDVRRYAQADATFSGFEVEGRLTVAEWGLGRLDLGIFYDRVSPSLDISANDNLPLMPPDRVGVSIEFTSDRLRANVDYVRAADQDDIAEFELPTDGYNDLRARIAWRLRPANTTVDLYLAGRNLTNDEQRLHTSVVKDLAPQPGRTIEAGMRMAF